jgi:hypothetical protein
VEKEHPFPSVEFGKATRDTLAKAGTVRLPYPPPASGPLFIGIYPDAKPELRSRPPRFFLRVVQKVSPIQVITRIVDLDELRGISLPATPVEEGTAPPAKEGTAPPAKEGTAPPAKEGKAPREFRTVDCIDREIAQAKERLIEASKLEAGVYEEYLFEDAVIYVREAAPVFLRLQYEFGVSAAEAAENVDRLVPQSGCCCKRLSASELEP